MKLIVLVKYEFTGANLILSLIKICLVKKASTQRKSFNCLTISERDLYMKSSLHDVPLHKLNCNLGAVSPLRTAPFSFLSPIKNNDKVLILIGRSRPSRPITQ